MKLKKMLSITLPITIIIFIVSFFGGMIGGELEIASWVAAITLIAGIIQFIFWKFVKWT